MSRWWWQRIDSYYVLFTTFSRSRIRFRFEQASVTSHQPDSQRKSLKRVVKLTRIPMGYTPRLYFSGLVLNVFGQYPRGGRWSQYGRHYSEGNINGDHAFPFLSLWSSENGRQSQRTTPGFRRQSLFTILVCCIYIKWSDQFSFRAQPAIEFVSKGRSQSTIIEYGIRLALGGSYAKWKIRGCCMVFEKIFTICDMLCWSIETPMISQRGNWPNELLITSSWTRHFDKFFLCRSGQRNESGCFDYFTVVQGQPFRDILVNVNPQTPDA